MAAKSNSTIGIVVLLAVIITVIGLFVFFAKPTYVWVETLETRTDQPYNLSIFKALLDSSTAQPLRHMETSVKTNLDTANGVNYFFFGQHPYMDSTEVATLLQFVERGNTAFIASNQFPEALFLELDQREIWLGYQDWTYSSKVYPIVEGHTRRHRFAFKGPKGFDKQWWSYIETEFYAEEEADFEDGYEDTDDSLMDQDQEEEMDLKEFFPENFEEEEDTVATETTEVEEYNWVVDEAEADSTASELLDGTYDFPLDDTYDEEPFDTTGWSHFETLGHYYNEAGKDTMFRNFFSVQIGEGTLYLHTSPVMFSNYFIIKDDGFEYVNEVLGNLDGKPVIWDAYHQIYREGPADFSDSQTPLRFIFAHAPLKYAWFTFLGSVLLFLLLRSKREQNIIPIIPLVENTSIAFAQSLGVLYHQAPSGRFLAIELMRMFDSFNRRHYGINRNRKDPNSGDEIIRRSRAERSLVENIIKLEMSIVYNPISKMTDVVKLYDQLEEYYKQAKK